jgi:hypothetical protein
VVISLLVSLRQWDRRLREGSARIEQALRLAQTMRTDIRQGTNVSLPAKDTLVITSNGNTETRYELAADGCRRTVGIADKAATTRDLFSIGNASIWSLENGPPGRRRMIIVSFDRSDAADDRPARPVPLLVYAALGADLPTMEPATDASASPTPE